LHEEIDRHQHEYLALQQANSTTVQQLQEQVSRVTTIGLFPHAVVHKPDQF